MAKQVLLSMVPQAAWRALFEELDRLCAPPRDGYWLKPVWEDVKRHLMVWDSERREEGWAYPELREK